MAEVVRRHERPTPKSLDSDKSSNICYFVVISRFVAIYALFGNLYDHFCPRRKAANFCHPVQWCTKIDTYEVCIHDVLMCTYDRTSRLDSGSEEYLWRNEYIQIHLIQIFCRPVATRFLC